MDYSIVKAIISSELRQHAGEKYITASFAFGTGEEELDMLKAQEYCGRLVGEGLCAKCDAVLMVSRQDYLYIEFKIQR